jgi:hypothetical protein
MLYICLCHVPDAVTTTKKIGEDFDVISERVTTARCESGSIYRYRRKSVLSIDVLWYCICKKLESDEKVSFVVGRKGKEEKSDSKYKSAH